MVEYSARAEPNVSYLFLQKYEFLVASPKSVMFWELRGDN